MKKVAMITLLAIGSIAMAASVSVPWFLDSGPTGAGIPPSSGAVSIVALHNNLDTPVTLSIMYYSDDGTELTGLDDPLIGGDRDYVWASDYNTFVITANATVQFRPVAQDPVPLIDPLNPLGLESASGIVVPDRPRYGAGTSTAKKNGSLAVSWVTGGPDGATGNSVQGRYVEYMGVNQGMYLLPPG